MTDPSNARGETVTAREVLDRGAERVRAELASEPLVQARLEQTIGDVYDALGLYDRAEPLHRSALETLRARARRGRPAHRVRDGRTGRSRSGGSGATTRRSPPSSACSRSARERLGDEDPDTLKTQNDLASLYLRRGDYARAEALYREAWESPPADPRRRGQLTLGARHNLANVLGNLGRHDEEAAHLEAVLEARRRTQGADHPDALGAAMNLSSTLQEMGRLDQAAGARRRDLRGHACACSDDEHPDTLSMLGNLGGLDLDFGRWESAIERYGRVVEARTRVLGPDHDQTLIGRRNLAYALEGAGRLRGGRGADPRSPRRASRSRSGPTPS